MERNHRKNEQKRRDAEQRNHDHSLLSVEQKITKAKKRDGDSKKELARLKKLLPVQVPVTAVPVAEPVKKVVKSKKVA